MRSAGEELQERKKQEAQRELEKQARREQEKAPEAIKEAARKVDGEKLSQSVADLGRKAAKYEAPKEDPHAWMSSSRDRRALPDKVEARTWSGLEAKATPELQAALPWDTSDIPTGNKLEEVARARRHLAAAARAAREIRRLLSTEEKIRPEVRDHLRPSPVEPHRPVDGRLW